MVFQFRSLPNRVIVVQAYLSRTSRGSTNGERICILLVGKRVCIYVPKKQTVEELISTLSPLVLVLTCDSHVNITRRTICGLWNTRHEHGEQQEFGKNTVTDFPIRKILRIENIKGYLPDMGEGRISQYTKYLHQIAKREACCLEKGPIRHCSSYLQIILPNLH